MNMPKRASRHHCHAGVLLRGGFGVLDGRDGMRRGRGGGRILRVGERGGGSEQGGDSEE